MIFILKIFFLGEQFYLLEFIKIIFIEAIFNVILIVILYPMFLELGEKIEQDFINNNTRKSIPLKYFEENGKLIKTKYNPRLDYINVINNIYFGGSLWKEEKN